MVELVVPKWIFRYECSMGIELSTSWSGSRDSDHCVGINCCFGDMIVFKKKYYGFNLNYLLTFRTMVVHAS